MRSAFGVEHVGKGLPSSISHTPMGQLKPLGQAKKLANKKGKQAARAEALRRETQYSRMGGTSTLRYIAGENRNAGRMARRQAQKLMGQKPGRAFTRRTA